MSGAAGAPFTVLAIPGSLRRASVNRALLEAAREAAPAGVEVVLWDGLGDLPFYNEETDAGDGPTPIAELRRRLAAADAVLISTPEYNSSIPGVLKNALDWASRPYGAAAVVGKPIAVAGASPSSFGAAWAQAEVRKVLAASGARVLEGGVTFAKAADRITDGRVKADDAVRGELTALLASLVELANTPLDADDD